MHDASDADLLREYARNDSEPAFAELVRRHVNLVYSAALRHVGIAAQAEEITQAVFVILARKAASLRRNVVLEAWLFETTRLTALSFLRGERRRQFREQEAYMQSVLQESTPDLIWQQLAPLLDEAMMRLGRHEREAVVLRFFKGRSLDEVAAALNIKEPAAQKRVSRALEKLRNHFAKRGVDSTADAITNAITANSVLIAPAGLAVAVTATAKGATISTSTLTLVKGALQAMAWTKTKTTAVASAFILLGAIGTITTSVCLHHVHYLQTHRLPSGDVAPMIGYGYSRNFVLLAPDGSLWSWGEERLGWPVLGITNVHHSVSLRRIGNETDWVRIAVGDSQNLAIKSDGTLWGWGENQYCQLGDGTKITRPTPVPSIPGHDWKQAATGTRSFAIKADGTLWAWGAGYLGTGDDVGRTNAVQIGTSTNWAKVVGGGIQTVGLQSDGSLWFWGSPDGNGRGTNNLLVPTRISPGTHWVDACFGYFMVLAIKSDGTLWAWGNRANFYTGVTDTNLNAVPMQVGTDSDWQSISSARGCFYHILKKTDGSFWTLDGSELRTIKPASEYKPIEFKKLDLPKDIVAFAAGSDNIGVILTRSGEVWTWGNVLGEHAPSAFWGPNNNRVDPKYKVIEKPWRLSIGESTDSTAK